MIELGHGRWLGTMANDHTFISEAQTALCGSPGAELVVRRVITGCSRWRRFYARKTEFEISHKEAIIYNIKFRSWREIPKDREMGNAPSSLSLMTSMLLLLLAEHRPANVSKHRRPKWWFDVPFGVEAPSGGCGCCVWGECDWWWWDWLYFQRKYKSSITLLATSTSSRTEISKNRSQPKSRLFFSPGMDKQKWKTVFYLKEEKMQ
jgi:hypothetical protein